jgi:two-component system OmpR family response regulator/two-component system response regulator RstA
MGREYNGMERTIDVRISTLRDKLASKGMEKTQIETVWGKGYTLNTLATSSAA